MNEDFINWLNDELSNRGWANSELARRIGMAPSTVSMLLNGQSRPGLDFCVGLARAFKVSPEFVARRAGIFPSRPAATERTDEVVYLFERLDEEKQAWAVAALRAWLEMKS